MVEEKADGIFQSKRLCRLRTVRRRFVRMGGRVSWRRPAGVGDGLASLGFVPARPGDGADLSEHEDLKREQEESSRRERDQAPRIGALSPLCPQVLMLLCWKVQERSKP